MNRIINCAGRALDLNRPCVMGILNVTPDSFSDGGDFFSLDPALRQAEQMVQAGVDIFDIGGESTRPGARPVAESEELDRVLPVIEALHDRFPVPISIDTSKAGVMREAVAAGAGFINDVMALRGEGALSAAREAEVPVCLMHMSGEPRTMQEDPQYRDVVGEIAEFLRQRVIACEAAMIPRERLLLDPGFGFGKTLEHNLALLGDLQHFTALGLPLLVGISRKSMLGTLLGGASVNQRLYAGLAAAVMAWERGASIIRVHDVAPTVEALKIAKAVIDGKG